jgi:hypothetical protein
MATATRLRTKGDFQRFGPFLAYLKPFRCYGALRGEVIDYSGSASVGRLSAEHVGLVRRSTVDYVVYSYETPIAWHNSLTGWHMPDTCYSLTTTQHQYSIRAALSEL